MPDRDENFGGIGANETIDGLIRRLVICSNDRTKAYQERNRLVRLLAAMFPSGITRTTIEGWSDDWQNCVYIDTPVGQLSWHYHDSEAHLFSDLPPYSEPWDGHTTEQKYGRITQLIQLLGRK